MHPKCVLIDRIAFSSQPIQIINSTIEMVKPGKFPSGKTEIPFEFPLHVKGNKVLYETYHGVFVNIQVRVSQSRAVDLLAWLLQKRLHLSLAAESIDGPRVEYCN